MQISKRLTAVSGLITSGYRLADVGTDHGYIPIRLVLSGKIPSAIAMDVNRGPLERAGAHIHEYGLEDRICTRLSDGLEKLKPGEADSILIAGMGGMLTVRILKNGRDVLGQVKELVLQPQSDIREVRRFLKAEGFRITDEDMVKEDGKFYPMMRAVPAGACQDDARARRSVPESGGAGRSVTETESTGQSVTGSECTGRSETESNHVCRDRSDGVEAPEILGELRLLYGPQLLSRRHPVLLRYLEYEKELFERVRRKLEQESGEAARRRLTEIKQSLELNAAARGIYRDGSGRKQEESGAAIP